MAHKVIVQSVTDPSKIIEVDAHHFTDVLVKQGAWIRVTEEDLAEARLEEKIVKKPSLKERLFSWFMGI